MDVPTRNRKSVSTKVDLTAMVDLGFLLITFFMLANTFGQPKLMEVLKPDAGDDFDYPQSKTATILIGPRDKAYGYSLPDLMDNQADVHVDTLMYESAGLRKYILTRQREVGQKWGDPDALFVLIKPSPHAPLRHVVDVLDEMKICEVKHFAIVELNTQVDSMILVGTSN